jgi:hypothetical protein
LREPGDKVSASARGRIEAQINRLKETTQSEDSGRFGAQLAEAQRPMTALGEVYDETAARPASPKHPGGKGRVTASREMTT